MYGAEQFVAPTPVASEPTPTATAAGVGSGIFGDPMFWLLILLMIWAGIVHLGLDVELGGH